MSITDKLTLIAENESKVYEAGKKAEYDRFWDAYQKNGTRYGYYYAFAGSGWNDTTFKPKYDIIFKGSNLYAFAYCEITDLAEALNKAGVILDTSQSTTNNLMFADAKIKRIPVIDLRGQTVLNNVFSGCKAETIEKVIVKEENTYSAPFNKCPNLKNIAFEGVIGNNGVSFQQSTDLTYDSCHSIFTHLKDFRVPTIISTNVTNTQTPTVIGKGTLTAGKQYTWRYYMSLYPGWMVDDPTQNPISDPEKDLAFEETSITSIAKEITINGNNYIGFNAECRNFPDETDGGYIIYVYQDGENIMVYPEIGGITSIDTIELTLLIAEETRTITMPKAVKDNGNATPEDIAEAEAKGWEITWAE